MNQQLVTAVGCLTEDWESFHVAVWFLNATVIMFDVKYAPSPKRGILVYSAGMFVEGVIVRVHLFTVSR